MEWPFGTLPSVAAQGHFDSPSRWPKAMSEPEQREGESNGSPGRTRTCNLAVNSRALYH